MDFERGKDIKDILEIGIAEVIQKIIRKRITSAIVSCTGSMREAIVDDVRKITGWEEVKDITSYDYPYIFRFQCVDPINQNIRIITINIRHEF